MTALKSLAGITLLVAVIVILGAATVPQMANASGAKGREAVTIQKEQFAVYAAFDGSGHRVPDCELFYLDGDPDKSKPHVNLDVRWHQENMTGDIILGLHLTIPDPEGNVHVYAPRSWRAPAGICDSVNVSELPEELPRWLTVGENIQRNLASEISGTVKKALEQVVGGVTESHEEDGGSSLLDTLIVTGLTTLGSVLWVTIKWLIFRTA